MNAVQDLSECADPALVGGKAANLGALIRAGFPVPDGFVITVAASGRTTRKIREAWRRLNAPVAAVRSSATLEDSRDTSFAGQLKTLLNIREEAAMLKAVHECRASAGHARVKAYLRKQGIGDRQFTTAVIVQRQIPAEVSGILFTASPAGDSEMLLEAAPGMGEAIVSGHVQPEAISINAQTGKASGLMGCLQGRDIAKLWELGRRAAAYFGAPQDIEWAKCGGEIVVLQSRPITGRDTATVRANILDETRKRLQASGRGPWISHNLGETLRDPTPLTWSILRRFMSGSGGFGAMYRRLGFEPSPAVFANGFLKLICGKVYMDLSRAPGLFGEHFPFAYDLERVRRSAETAELPPSIPRGSFFERFRAGQKMAEAQRRIDRESCDFDARLNDSIIPEFVEWCRREKSRDLSALPTEEWLALWKARQRRVFDEFAPQILFTNFIAGSALAALHAFVEENFWNDEPKALAQLLASTGAPNRTLIADAELYEVAQGQRKLEDWVAQHGHRAVGEFDLAAPRWRETQRDLRAYASRLKDGRNPLALHAERVAEAEEKLQRLPARLADPLGARVQLARRYVRFREDGKDFLMLGYDLLRDLALEAARRLGPDIFWLTFEELTEALRGGVLPQAEIERRKTEHRAVTRMTLPQFIDDGALATLGEEPKFEQHDCLTGIAISSGSAGGVVRIVKSPLEAKELGRDYILVCPSTDPAWTPLFVNAAGLVLECGGTLSHGAIVAREMNIPAVVLPNATLLLREGEQVVVDGSHGIVARNGGHGTGIQDIPRDMIPPVPGDRERRGARLRNAGFAIWGVYLIAAFALPAGVLYEPTLRALDWLLWPLVSLLGKPALVAVAGAGVAALSAFVQKSFADNVRLNEAKRRIRQLKRKVDDPRCLALVESVQRRVIGASLVSVGMLLGILVMTFAWLAARMDPSAASPMPGSAARMTASIDADFRGPVTLSAALPLRLDESSTAARLLPPIRETLEKLMATTDGERLADLQAYLKAGVPPQTVSWTIRSDKPGRFPMTLSLGGRLVTQDVVFGEQFAPVAGKTIRDQTNPLRMLKVESVARRSSFWKPFQREIGWAWIYLLAYLPAWLFLRRILQLV